MRKKGIICLVLLALCLNSWLYAYISTSVNYPASSGMMQPVSFRSYENGYSYQPNEPLKYVSGMVYITPIEPTTPYSQGLTENLTRQHGTQWWGTGLYTLKVPEGTDLSKPISSSSALAPRFIDDNNEMPLKIYGPSQVIYRPAMVMSVPSETNVIPLKSSGETEELYDARTPNSGEITPPTTQLIPR